MNRTSKSKEAILSLSSTLNSAMRIGASEIADLKNNIEVRTRIMIELEAENGRLQSQLESSRFVNRVLSVLILGVISYTLVLLFVR